MRSSKVIHMPPSHLSIENVDLNLKKRIWLDSSRIKK